MKLATSTRTLVEIDAELDDVRAAIVYAEDHGHDSGFLRGRVDRLLDERNAARSQR